MPSPRIGYAGGNLPGPSVIYGLYDPAISLAAGRTWLIPAGTFAITPGPVTMVQNKDPISGLWRTFGAWGNQTRYLNSDGVNFRLANLTGCMVGALLTNKGSGYTSAPTVTASAGSPALTAILSPSLSSVTITTAGSGYTYPPIVIVAPPPSGGIPATAIATISGGVVNAVTVINEGAGYSAGIPTITVITDPRDTSTTIVSAVLTGVLTAAGTVKAVVVTDPGAPQTAVATLSFAGGGGSAAAATAIYCFAVTDFTVGAGGAAYGNAQPVLVLGYGGIVSGTAANANPAIEKGIFQTRMAVINAFSDAGGAIITTNEVISDPGLSQNVPLLAVIAGGSGLATTVAQLTATVGGITDTSIVQPV